MRQQYSAFALDQTAASVPSLLVCEAFRGRFRVEYGRVSLLLQLLLLLLLLLLLFSYYASWRHHIHKKLNA